MKYHFLAGGPSPVTELSIGWLGWSLGISARVGKSLDLPTLFLF